MRRVAPVKAGCGVQVILIPTIGANELACVAINRFKRHALLALQPVGGLAVSDVYGRGLAWVVLAGGLVGSRGARFLVILQNPTEPLIQSLQRLLLAGTYTPTTGATPLCHIPIPHPLVISIWLG